MLHLILIDVSFSVFIDGQFQRKMKCTSSAFFALQLKISMEKIDEFFGYREPKTCTSIFPGCVHICLSKALEDFLLFVCRNSDACIFHHELNGRFLTC